MAVATASGGGDGAAPGVAVIVLGGLVVLTVFGGLMIWARVAQRRYFRAYERARGVTVHDPHAWEMCWSDVFARHSNYWSSMLSELTEPELVQLRRQVLTRAAIAVGVLAIGLLVVLKIGSLAGYG